MVGRCGVGHMHRLAGPEPRCIRQRPQAGIALQQVIDDLTFDRLAGPLGQWRVGLDAIVRGPPGQLLGGDVALVDEELADAHQPFFVVAELEVLEGLHALGARAQRGPGPGVLERGGQAGHRILRQRLRKVGALGHHHRVDAEDALLPFLHEDPGFEVHRPEVLEAAQRMLEFHGCSISDSVAGAGSRSG